MKFKTYLLLLAVVFVTTACTEDVTVDMPQGEDRLVVEGYIEADLPPYVILTRSMPYFTSTSLDDMGNIFVQGAKITVSDGSKTVDMMEINLNTLPDSFKSIVKDVFSFSTDQLAGVNFSFYTTLEMFGEIGKTYTLNIAYDGKQLEASTTVPRPVSLDSTWIEPHPNPENDSLVSIVIQFTDPVEKENYYRYFTKTNREPYYPDRFVSVFDDKLYDGEVITFPLTRGEERMSEFNPLTYGYFSKGDTIMIKLCTIDEKHFRFWQTFENDNLRGGPFASPVQVQTNVDGGLGIWGGYGSFYKKVIIPR